MSRFKIGDPITWYRRNFAPGDLQTVYYAPVDGFVVSLSEHGCVVGENETGRVFWFDNSLLQLTYECDHKIRYGGQK